MLSLQSLSPAESAAERLATNCFVNALLRECRLWRHVGAAELPSAVTAPRALCLHLDRGCVYLPLRHYSPAGRHDFELPLWLDARSTRRPIDLRTLAALIAAESSVVGAVGQNVQSDFVARVMNSRANLHDALLARRTEPRAPSRSFIGAEQDLLAGHSVHPAPRARDGWSAAEARRYAPECGGRFRLFWFAVHPSVLEGDSAVNAYPVLLRELFEASCPVLPPGCKVLFNQGLLPFPAHPWQAGRLRRNPEVARLIAAGAVHPLGEAGAFWRPTTSTRTVYAKSVPWMLKFSLDLRLTNSVRLQKPEELKRGVEVHRLMRGAIGQRLAERYPAFTVLGEPAYVSLCSEPGHALAASSVALRENPFRGPAATDVYPVATLCQDAPDGEPLALAHHVGRHAARSGLTGPEAAEQWFQHFLQVAVEPLLVAHAEDGLLFGAHQQNLLIGLERDLPARAYFRDCQGTGYTRESAAVTRRHRQGHHGYVLDTESAARALIYYLFVNTVLSLVSAFGRDGLIDEMRLLLRLRRFIADLRLRLRGDTSVVEALLDSPTLWCKGNFLICFSHIDENARAGDPLELYTEIPNPLKGVDHE